ATTTTPASGGAPAARRNRQPARSRRTDMANQASTAQPPQRLTLLGKLLSLPGALLGLLLVSLLCSLLMEYAGMLWFWPEQGWRHSQAMLHAELGWLGEQ